MKTFDLFSRAHIRCASSTSCNKIGVGLLFVFLCVAHLHAQPWECGYPNSEDVTASLSGGTLTITGTGAMANYAEGTAPWYGSRNSIAAVVINENVTTIGDYAFFGFSLYFNTTTIPSTISSIGNYAFSDCKRLISVTINRAIPFSINTNVFEGCVPRTVQLNVPAGSETAYSTATGWQDFYIEGYSSLPSGSCGDDLVWAYDILTGTLTITGTGDMDDNPEWSSFAYKIKALDLPVGLTSISDEAFQSCTSLSSLTIPEGVSSIGKYAFRECNIGSLSIPGSVASIGEEAFSNCVYLTSVTIANGVPAISKRMFYMCMYLTTVNIPASVLTIGDHAFSSCSALTTVNLPANLTTIGNDAFSYCSKLESITIPGTVTTIGDNAFIYCTALTSAVFSTGIQTIGNGMFQSCTKLASVALPESVTVIGEYAFAGCTVLNTTIPQNVTTINDWAFAKCSALTSAVLPEKAIKIGDNAFYECTQLSSLTIPAGVTSIGSLAFYGCTQIETVYFNATNCTTYSTIPFNGCTGINAVIVGDNVIRLPDNAFYNCSGLTSLTIGNKVTDIGGSAFSGCDGLATINCKPVVPPDVISGTFSNGIAGTCTLFVPLAGYDDYRADPVWGAFYNILIEGYDAYYSVTFDTQGGTPVNPQTIYDGGKAAVPPYPGEMDLPPIAGLEFIGWYKEPTCITAWNFSTDLVTSDTTLYAKWKAEITIDSQSETTFNAEEDNISVWLYVNAHPSAGVELNFQWYSNTSPSNSGGTVISDSTRYMLILPTDLVPGSYYYFCEITAEWAEPVRSDVVTVTVSETDAPVISVNTQPEATTNLTIGNITEEDRLVFLVGIEPYAPPTYQWYMNTTNSYDDAEPVDGHAEYPMYLMIPEDLEIGTYYYYCKVTAGKAIPVLSNIAKVTVSEVQESVIEITSQPETTKYVTEGNINAYLLIEAEITPEALLKYQWYSHTEKSNEDGIAIEGENNFFFVIPDNLTKGSYYYYCEVSSAGAATVSSDVATVIVSAVDDPVITIEEQPAETTTVSEGNIGVNDYLLLGVTVEPTVPLTYQWYSNTENSFTDATPVSGVEGNPHAFAIPTDLKAGTYYYFCEVSAEGAIPVLSNMATVIVSDEVIPIIHITDQPDATINILEGEASGVMIFAVVEPYKAPTYQWYSNTTNANTGGSPIAGETNNVFAFPTNLTKGTYYYYCLVSSPGAVSVPSDVVTVNVGTTGAPEITITSHPTALTTVTEGAISGNLSVTATVTQGASLTYEWYSDVSGAKILVAVGSSFDIPTNLTEGTYYYYCEITGTGGAVSKSSNVATVIVNPPVGAPPVITITGQPAATTNVTEGNVSGSISVEAKVTQDATLIYQWFSNDSHSNTGGTAISGATFPFFAIPTNLNVSESPYYYFCEVSATDATPVRSEVATVNVSAQGVPLITILSQPEASTSITEGNVSVTLHVSATVTESATLSYQWYSNDTNSNTDGTAITGAESQNFTVPSTLAAGTYYYYCQINATGGALPIASNVSRVTVSVVTYTITFNSLGGSSVPNQTVSPDGKATPPADPTRTGHLFEAWYTDINCTSVWDFNATVTGDMTLYAKWTPTTSAGEIFAPNMKVYPNPFTDAVRITDAEGCTLRVINAAGMIIYTQKIESPDEMLRMQNLPAGMYFFRVEKNKQAKTIKAIKN